VMPAHPYTKFYQATLKSNGIPGGIVTIQTHGNMLNIHPHTHVIVSDGLFCEKNKFYQMPPIDKRGRACLRRIFENKVTKFCLKNGMVKEETVMTIFQWTHTGFSVYTNSRMDLSLLDESLLSGKETNIVNDEQQKIAQMLRYVSKPFFSQEKIVLKEGADRILYKGELASRKKKKFRIFFIHGFYNRRYGSCTES